MTPAGSLRYRLVERHAVDRHLAEALQHATWSPGRPMTRLMRWSLLSGAVSPTIESAQSKKAGDTVRLGGRGAGRQPAARVLEDDDVAALDRHQLGLELVDDDAVVDLQGVLHRLGRDVERADQERLDQERDDDRREQDEQDVADEPPGRLAAAGRSPASSPPSDPSAVRARASRADGRLGRRCRRRQGVSACASNDGVLSGPRADGASFCVISPLRSWQA